MPFPDSRPHAVIAHVRHAFDQSDVWPASASDDYYQGMAAKFGLVGRDANGAFVLTDGGRRETGLDRRGEKHRDSILATSPSGQIGYVEGADAFDLNGNRLFYLDGARNLINPETLAIEGHLQPAGENLNASSPNDKLFPISEGKRR